MTMKKLILIFSLFFSTSLWAAEDPIYSSFFGGAIDGYDAVAYFTEAKAVKGSKKITYEYQGAKWRFASEENKKLFIENPEKYIPEYGGYCAYAMSDNRFVSIDGEAWHIESGKLYLNYSKSVQGHWLKEKDKFIQEADANWQAYWQKHSAE